MPNDGNGPDFILIGAPKSGTTSLYHYLQQHPQVAMSSVKEPHFFLFDGPDEHAAGGPLDDIWLREMIRDWPSYQALFQALPDDAIKGEASIRYLYSDQARQAIARRLPHSKLLLMLRHPADRAYSAYQRDRRLGRESRTRFEEAWADCPRREQERWHMGNLRAAGFYAQHLKHYLETFGPERLKVFLFDDLLANPQQVMRETYDFIGVDPDFEPDLKQRFNETGVIANPVLRFLWHDTRRLRSHLLPYVPMRWRGKLIQWLSTSKVNKSENVPINPATRTELTACYRDDIRQLQDLLDRDLSHWLVPSEKA